MSIKIISGGQTGADRAGLDFAIDHRLCQGGFCPKGRRAEDGTVSMRYHLVETSSSSYAIRTEKNVMHSDATVIFRRDDLPSPGSCLTERYCCDHNKALLILGRVHDPEADAERLNEWLHKVKPGVLNIAGHRESTCPGIHAYVYRVLTLTQHLCPLLAS